MTSNIRTGTHIIVCFILLAAAFAAHAETLDEAIASVENHYQQLHDLTAKVAQNNLLKSIGKTQKFEGRLWIKKPGKLGSSIRTARSSSSMVRRPCSTLGKASRWSKKPSRISSR